MADLPRRIDAEAFFSDEEPGDDVSLPGKELVRAYWRTRSLRAELARKERYWMNICEALGTAYTDLERTTRELAETRAELARLNAELEKRVDAQSQEIETHAAKIERLNQHLSARVEARSQELLAFARELGASAARVEPGTVLNGRTRVSEPIGEGGSGVVYRAHDDVLGGHLAVKVLRRPHDPDATLRFLAEAGAASRAPHPAVVRPLHLDVSEAGLPYLVMEHVDGRSLRAHLASEGALPTTAVCRLGAVLVYALASAHAAGLVHRDVKPGNIMLTTIPPGLRVLDFGLSRALDGSATRTGVFAGRLLGTPAYMSPEQIVDPASAGPPADIYSAGATLFEACAGRLPFVATTPEALSHEHLSARVPDLRALRREVPAALASLVAASLEKRPEDRPRAMELGAALDALAGELGALAAHAEVARILAPRGEETTQ
jgi:hypothetical protein